MPWNLFLTPKGLLLSKYLKNSVILNPQNINLVGQNQVLNNSYRAFDPVNNTVDLVFSLYIVNDDPRSDQNQPDILGFNQIFITNDQNFVETFALLPENFIGSYNSYTDYTCDLSQYVSSADQLPLARNVAFSQTAGSGNIIITGWPLSNSSGLKKIFFGFSVLLADGTTAQFPGNLSGYDEIYVLSDTIYSPGVPKAINGFGDYVGSSAILAASASSSSGLIGSTDLSITSYFWDNILLGSVNSGRRNNPGTDNYLFNNVQISNTDGNMPSYYTIAQSSGIGSSALYADYISPNAFQFTSSNNIYWSEIHYKVDAVQDYNTGAVFFLESNLISATTVLANTKYIRQQFVSELSAQKLDIYTSVDDSAWSTNPSYVPNVNYTLQSVINPELVSKVLGGGVIITLVEIIDTVNNIFQVKTLFKTEDETSYAILNEQIFSSNLSINTNVYCEFRCYVRSATTTVTLKSNQYGAAYGVISASVTPSEKISPQAGLPYYYNFANQTALNTWFKLYNSSAVGTISYNFQNDYSGNLLFYSNSSSPNNNNLALIEAQSSIPTFSEENVFSLEFYTNMGGFTPVKVGWSVDGEENFNNFTFSDLLTQPAGQILPDDVAQYSIFSKLAWDNGEQYDLYCLDVETGETCSLANPLTEKLFYYTSSNRDGTLTSPAIIKTRKNSKIDNTLSYYINANGNPDSNIISEEITINNLSNKGLYVNAISLSPGDSFTVNSISKNSLSPTTVDIQIGAETIENSINFLYDFSSEGSISKFSISIKIANPPDCPTSLPNFVYAVSTTPDFINWTNYSSEVSVSSPYVTIGETFDVRSGRMLITFSLVGADNTRYAKLKIYGGSIAGFPALDPTLISYNYYAPLPNSGSSSVNLISFTPNKLPSTTGKFVFGFTDTSAKNGNLGQYYNQPTLLRTITGVSNITALGLDFSNYSSDTNGPVDINLITSTGEYVIHTISSGFLPTLDSPAVARLRLSKSDLNDDFKLIPTLEISCGSIDLSLEVPQYQFAPLSDGSLACGYYPFITLAGNGYFVVTSSTNSTSEFQEPGSHTYFSLFSGQNSDFSSGYGKNLLSQNVLNQSILKFPLVGSYFSQNKVKFFSYNPPIEAPLFTVAAAITTPVSLYGLTYADGVYLSHCDYILLSGQRDKTQNGVYQVQYQQWLKYNFSSNENTVYVQSGNIFGDTLWLEDLITGEWIPNVIQVPIYLPGNSLLSSGISTYLNYPQYIRVAVASILEQNTNSLDQVKIKLVNSPKGYITDTDSVSQWNSLLQNNYLSKVNTKSSANNTVFSNFAISSSQIAGITTISFPASYNLLISFSGNNNPLVTRGTALDIHNYGKGFRMFRGQNVIYQAFSKYEPTNIVASNGSFLNSGVYAMSESEVKSPQSGFSTSYTIDSLAPTLGILSSISDSGKIVLLGLSSAFDSGSGLNLARIAQTNPINQLIYGSWFSMNDNSYYGIATFAAYPSFISDENGMVSGEPLSGFYRYYLQAADNTGNISQTNEVESFYIESALVDTQGPTAKVNFVSGDYSAPISITSSTFVVAQLNADDAVSGVKAFRYRIFPNKIFSNWIDYNNFTNIYFPESVEDGVVSAEFQFKDFANNVLYNSGTNGQSTYTYTWNIVSKLLTNCTFTVIEKATYNNKPVLLIGASQNNSATLFVWNGVKLSQIIYSGLIFSSAITAMKNVNGLVVIGDNLGKTYIYSNGLITGPFAQFKIGETPLPISKFEIHTFASENTEYVYASTLNFPRLFRTLSSNLNAGIWQQVATQPITLESINVINSGLWSGNSISYSISSSYVPAVLGPIYSYGVGSVIVSNSGSKYKTIPQISASNLSGSKFNVTLMGSLGQLQVLNPGTGYTSGATVQISAPPAGIGTIQAAASVSINFDSSIFSVILTNPGYGYTSAPIIQVVGNSGHGAGAVIIPANSSNAVIYDSIYSVTVGNPGIGTTSNISLIVTPTGIGTGAVLSPSLIYRLSDMDIVNPGFGYTATPGLIINGLSTIASVTIGDGSIQSVNVSGKNSNFSLNGGFNYSLSGGVATNVVVSVSTSLISFVGNGTVFSGTVVNSINVIGKSYGIGTLPRLNFSNAVFNPEISYSTSNDLLLSGPNGSIYDIKSFDGRLFISNSINGISFLAKNNNQFTLDNLNISQNSSDLNLTKTYGLETYENGYGTSLYFTALDSPLVGEINRADASVIFEKFQNNVLLYSPKNFDILSDWQLVRNYNTGGISTVSLVGVNSNLLSIQTENGQTFYQSTKNNIWFNRCRDNQDYGLTFVFEAKSGTQAFEISNFVSTLKLTFAVRSDGLLITLGNDTFQQISAQNQAIYSITVVKENNNIYINDNKLNIVLAVFYDFFASGAQANPIIRFGYLYEPENVFNNGADNLILGYAKTSSSNFVWHSLKVGFTTNTSVVLPTYEVNTNYVLPNSSAIRVLKNLNGHLYAISKSIHDQRSTTDLSDLSSRVFRFNGSIWSDITGNFENNLIGVSSVYTIVSPNDVNSLGDSYFISGILNKITNKSRPEGLITIGLSTGVVYEEQDINVVIIYPYNPNPAGTFIQLSSNSSIITNPAPVYFGPQDVAKIVQVGLGSTSISSVVSLIATDGTNTSSLGLTVKPIVVSGVSLSTDSYVSYSNDMVVSTVTLTAAPRTPRTYQLNSSNNSVLSAPNSGIQTILSGSASSSVILINGIATFQATQVSISAIYRGIATDTIIDNPFILTSSLNVGFFTGNQYYGNIIYAGTLSNAPIGTFFIDVVSSQPNILGFSTNKIKVLPNAFSTSVTMIMGAAVTNSRSIQVSGFSTGIASTASIIALPLLIQSVTSNATNPVIGLQTSFITYTLNTTPASNVTITNIISNPAGVGMIFPGISTVLAGGLTTTFGLSTTIQASAIGLAITVQGAPFGYNTFPIPGLSLFTDIWRISSLNVSPISITGGANNANGVAQSFIVAATLNFSTSGLSTSIILSGPTNLIGFNTTILVFNESTTAVGYATGFSTSVVAPVTISASGPNGYTSSFSNLSVTPFLVNSFSIIPSWPYLSTGVSTLSLIGGIAATAVGTVVLSAYVASGVQTVEFSSPFSGLYVYGQTGTYPFLGIATVSASSNTTTVNFGATQTSSYISTSVAATVQSSPQSISTTAVVIDTLPSHSLVFNPFLATTQTTFSITLSKALPIATQIGVAISSFYKSYVLGANQIGGGYQFSLGVFKTDVIYSALISYLGVTQKYFVDGFATSGGPFGVGYNYSGSLSRFNPNTGSPTSAAKYYMGLPNAIKTASGNLHNLAIDSLGNVYAIGDNTYGQLGKNNLGTQSTSIFTRVNFLYSARNIYAQNNTSYVITADNSLWSFGDNSYYCLGTSLPSASTSTSVPYLMSTSVQLFSVSNYRGSVLIFNNKNGDQSLFEFGRYSSGPGLIRKNISQVTYSGSTRNISNLVISQIDVGPSHTVASGTWDDVSLGVSSSGIFAWGFNTSGQIGLNTSVAFSATPNVLTKYTPSGIVPIEVSNLIFADSQFTMIVSGNTPNNQGYVAGATISSSGIGYTAGATVTFSPPPAGINTATAIGVALTSGGYITSVSISSSGIGYTSGAIVIFSDPAPGVGTVLASGIAITSNGQITSVVLTNQGLGYTLPPVVTFSGNNGIGSYATGYASVSYAQVASITVTSPGFGYTQAPIITINGNLNHGNLATGFAQLLSNASNINSIYLFGKSNVYNSAGLISGINTIASAMYFDQGSALYGSTVYKVAKSEQHYVWTLGQGSSYVTGGVAVSMPLVAASTKANNSLYASNSYNGTSYLNFFVSLDGSGVDVVLFTISFASTILYAVTPKKAVQSLNLYSTRFPDRGGYLAVINSSNNLDVFYAQQSYPSSSRSWLGYQQGVTDLSIGGYDATYLATPGGTNSGALATGWIYTLSPKNIDGNWTVTLFQIQSLYNTESASYIPDAPTAFGSYQFYAANSPTKIDGYQIYGFSASSWNTVDPYGAPYLLNFVVGFDDGLVALYGYKYDTGIIEIITSWSVGSPISCLRSMTPSGSPGTARALFVASQDGGLRSYNAYGYTGQQPVWFTSLSPGQSLRSIVSTNIITQNSSQFGYITMIEDYNGQSIIAATSGNYVLIINIDDLRVIAFTRVPSTITSIMWGSGYNVNNPPSGVLDYIYVTTSNGSNSGNTFIYYAVSSKNYEMGLNYANISGEAKLLTYSGDLQGLGMTSLFNASTGDTMTLVLDSSRPRG